MYVKTLSLKNSWAIALRDVLKMGLFVLLLSLSSRIRIYLPYSPVPVTFQTLVVYLSAVFLGARAFYPLLSYIALGIFGAPVFSAGAGLVYLLGPTGGYILGFLLASIILIRMLPFKKNILWYFFCFCLADAAILMMGTLWIILVMRVSLAEAVSLGILPFVYGDCLKIILATLITRIIRNSQLTN